MAIESLLWFCLDHRTSIEEQRIGLSIVPQQDETILCFCTDSEAFRTRFYDPRERQISCDALFFYKYADKPPVLIFVELKGANLVHALDQLTATIGAVKPKIEHAVRESTKYLALVVSDGSLPTSRKNKQREFHAKTQVALHIKSTTRGKRAVDLRAVLRGVEALAPYIAN